MWTTFKSVQDVPAGQPLNYLTLLALSFTPLHAKAVTGLIVGVGKSVHELVESVPECFDGVACKAMKAIYDIQCESVVGLNNVVHVWKVRDTNPRIHGKTELEAVQRAVCAKELAGMVLTVPTALIPVPVPQFQQWLHLTIQRVCGDAGYRAAMGGKSETSMAHLQYSLQTDPERLFIDMIEAEQETNPAPEGYLKRLKELLPTGRVVCVAGDQWMPCAGQDRGVVVFTDYDQLMVTGGHLPGRATRLMGAGSGVADREHVKEIMRSIADMGHDIILVDEFHEYNAGRIPLMIDIETDVIPGRLTDFDVTGGDPYHQARCRYRPTDYYVRADHDRVRKSKRKLAKAARKVTKRKK